MNQAADEAEQPECDRDVHEERAAGRAAREKAQEGDGEAESYGDERGFVLTTSADIAP